MNHSSKRKAQGSEERAGGRGQAAGSRGQAAGSRPQEAGSRQAGADRIRRRILSWYRKHKRDLPWRRTRDPYRIWISEIMLQQTRAAAVIPYYQRFLDRFPNVSVLASASEQELLAAWAGLGYYSRARNLQKAAKKIQEARGFPDDYASLRTLPGVGDYTAAAIASIAFDSPHAVLDGNVIRVLSRFTGEPGNVDSVTVKKRLREVAGQILDSRHAGEFNQAMMELGATVCLPKAPQCARCPLSSDCVARHCGIQSQLPVKAGKPVPSRVNKDLLVIEQGENILFRQREGEARRMAGFWELPEPDQLPAARVGGKIGQFRHTIVNTIFRFRVFHANITSPPRGFLWLSKRRLDELPLTTTAKKALACCSKHDK